ncbi:MAG TPA: alpha/beta fold hydrolase [Ktedonosporobacter sp.]|jgi:pimeloyl-ACP methyl ester carboxylesterase|nr:alpha/beta fold hydrolase [Ktedonosporobacter sp.]
MAGQKGQNRWFVGLATSTGILGLSLTSGLTMLAFRFVEEFSHPHLLLQEAIFDWEIPHTAPEPPLERQRSLLFKTVDNTLLRGDFWAQPQKAPTIVLCHGYRVSRTYLREAAALEYQRGYNVFSFDFRGHGESDSVTTSGGKAEVRDLEAAIFVASRQPETLPGKIVIHGFSMGASVALLMSPHPDVVAIIADSPYAHSDDILRRLVNYRLTQESRGWIPLLQILRCLFPAIAWATIATSAIVFRLRFGFHFVAHPAWSFKYWKTHASAKKLPIVVKTAAQKQIMQHRSTPILLIHSSGDMLIPIEHARKIAAEAILNDVPLETYFVDHPAHCGAYICNPHQYTSILQKFLEHHLGDDFPEGRQKIDIIG